MHPEARTCSVESRVNSLYAACTSMHRAETSTNNSRATAGREGDGKPENRNVKGMHRVKMLHKFFLRVVRIALILLSMIDPLQLWRL